MKDNQPTVPRISAFVYGTLKRGQRNHERYCQGAISIVPATVSGRLYALPAGYPALEVPEEHILAQGTADPLADAAAQASLATTMEWGVGVARPEGDWDLIHGQLIELADPMRSLPPIDRLEGFQPGGFSLYQRVLLPVLADGVTRGAWAYTMTKCANHHRLWEGVWH